MYSNHDTFNSLVFGSVQGNFKSCFTKMASVNQKAGPFNFAICIGDFFDQEKGIEELLGGRIQIPLECYVTLGHKGLPQKVVERITEKAGEICNNLFFIGRSIDFRINAIPRLRPMKTSINAVKDVNVLFHCG